MMQLIFFLQACWNSSGHNWFTKGCESFLPYSWTTGKAKSLGKFVGNQHDGSETMQGTVALEGRGGGGQGRRRAEAKVQLIWCCFLTNIWLARYSQQSVRSELWYGAWRKIKLIGLSENWRSQHCQCWCLARAGVREHACITTLLWYWVSYMEFALPLLQ